MKKTVYVLGLFMLLAMLVLAGCTVNTDADISGDWTLEEVAGASWSSWGQVYTFEGGKFWLSSAVYPDSEPRGNYSVSAGQIILSDCTGTGLTAGTYSADLQGDTLTLKSDAFAVINSYKFKKK